MNTWNLTVMDLIIIYQIFFPALTFLGRCTSLPFPTDLGRATWFASVSEVLTSMTTAEAQFGFCLYPTFTWIKHALGIHYYKEGEKKTLISLRLNLSLYPCPAVPLHEAELPSSAQRTSAKSVSLHICESEKYWASQATEFRLLFHRINEAKDN